MGIIEGYYISDPDKEDVTRVVISGSFGAASYVAKVGKAEPEDLRSARDVLKTALRRAGGYSLRDAAALSNSLIARARALAPGQDVQHGRGFLMRLQNV